MSDVTVLPTGGTSSGGSGPNWMLIGGLGAGAIVLFLLMSKSGSSAGQPTTAAGTSINAALGSIQEQNLNLMGEVSQNAQALSGQVGSVNDNVTTSYNALTGQLSGVGDEITKNQTSLLGQLASINNGVIATNQSVAGLGQDIAQQQANYASQFTRNFEQLNSTLAGNERDLNRQLVGQQYIEMANATALTAGAADPRVVGWLQAAQRVLSGG